MTFFRNFFQNLFGGYEQNDNKNQRFDDRQSPNNGFKNPIWQNNGENDDDSDDYRLFANSDRNSTFQIFANPFEMMQYFESQMDNMMKFGLEKNFPKMLPPPNQSEHNLRDEFLKPNRSSSSNGEECHVKIDADLDGKISVHDVPLIWKNFDAAGNKQQIQLNDDANGSDSFESQLNSPYSHMAIKPNITMEQISTITDSAGNTETIIKRHFGDKIHTIVTKRSKDNVETKTETFANINENDTWPGSKFGGTLLDKTWDRFFNPHLK